MHTSLKFHIEKNVKRIANAMGKARDKFDLACIASVVNYTNALCRNSKILNELYMFMDLDNVTIQLCN